MNFFLLPHIFSKLESSLPLKRVDVEDRLQPTQSQQQQQQQQQPQQQQQQQQQQRQQQQQQLSSHEFQTLRDDLRDKSARLEAALSEKNTLARKLKSLEQRDGTDHNKKVKSRI
jgi:hypothetical protein